MRGKKNTLDLLIKIVQNKNTSAVEIKQTDLADLIATAAKHRLMPLLMKNIRSVPLNFPAEISANLQSRAELGLMRSLKFNSCLFKITNFFDANQIDYISYKGTTLSQLAYGEPHLRQFGDIDLLIHKEDFPKVKNLLLNNGAILAWDMTEKQERAVLKYYYEMPFMFGKKPRVLVELHWDFMESFFGFDYDLGDAFARRQTISIQGKNVDTLSNEDLIVYLAVHGTKHFWKRLGWICDVGNLVENQKIDWDLTIKLAKTNGCSRMLNLALSLARETLQVNLPQKVSVAISKEKHIGESVRQIIKSLEEETVFVESNNSFHLKMKERWRDKILYSHRLFKTKAIDSIFMPMGRPR